MSELVVVGFDNPEEADRVLVKLNSLQKEYLVDLEDAVVVVRDASGNSEWPIMPHPVQAPARLQRRCLPRRLATRSAPPAWPCRGDAEHIARSPRQLPAHAQPAPDWGLPP